MIWNFLIEGFFGFFTIIFMWLPEVTIADIYYFGEGISSNLITVVQHWNSFIDTFPYAEVAWTEFLWAVIPFELTMLGLKILLGHRVPTNDR